MSQKTAFTQLREQAIALRRAGKSRREIKDLLAITSNWTLDEALRGEPPQPWTRRPNAKDDLRAKARELRKQGLDYEEIVAELGVSKSSVSLWVRDLPRPPRLSYEECRKRAAEGLRRYWAAEGPSARPSGRPSLRPPPPRSASSTTARPSSPGRLPTGAKAPRTNRTVAMIECVS
jgi:hypothetical protein